MVATPRGLVGHGHLAAVYVLVGEAQPAIWLLPMVVMLAALVTIDRLTAHATATLPH